MKMAGTPEWVGRSSARFERMPFSTSFRSHSIRAVPALVADRLGWPRILGASQSGYQVERNGSV